MMSLRIWVTVIGCLLLCGMVRPGAAQRFAHQHYGIGEGLDNVRVYYLLSDAKGRIWVGTDWGLDYFDPERQLINQRQRPSLPQGFINDLATGPDGSVWVASNELYQVRIGAGTTMRVDTHFVGYSPHFNRVGTSFLTVDHRNQVWTTGLPGHPYTEKGICYLEKGQLRDATPRLFPKAFPGVVDLKADRRNRRVLVVTKDGRLWEIPADAKPVGPARPVPLTGKVKRLLESPDGRLYGLTDEALYCLAGRTAEKRFSLPASVLNAKVFAISAREEVAFCDPAGYLCWFDGLRLTNSRVPTAPVRSLLFDRSGNLWAGTTDGINQVIRTGWRYFDHMEGWQQETISATEDRNGVLWFASRGHGLSRLVGDRLIPDSTYLKTLPTRDFIAATHRDASGNLIFSSVGGEGLLWYDGKEYRVLPESKQGTNIRGFYDDVAGNRYLFATSKKLLIYDRRTLALKQITPLPTTGYYAIEKDRQGRFWMGGQGSTVIWDGHSARYDTLPHHQGTLPVWMTFQMFRDPRGNLWLATDRGLWLYDYKRFRRVAPDHLQRIVYFCRPIGRDYLLLGTIEGLYVLDLNRFYRTGQEWLAWFDQKNGFGGQCIPNGAFRDSRSRWWLPTHDRIMVIPEKQLIGLLKPVATGIESVGDLRTGRRFQATPSELRLSPDQNDLEIRLREPDPRSLVANTTYTYRLERLDAPQSTAEWSAPVRTNTIALRNLSDGNYRLTVRPLRATGLWDTRPMVQLFRITAPWWATWWFRMLALLAVSGSIFYLRLRQVRNQARRRQEVLEARQRVTELELETANRRNQEAQMHQALAEASRERALLEVRAITNQIDPHFVSNFLTAMQAVLYDQDAKTVTQYLAKFGTIFRHKLLSRSKVFWTLSEELDFVRNYLDLEKLRFRSRIEFLVEVDPTVPTDTSLPKMLIQGYVSNAIKHGLENKPGGGTVKVKVGRQTDYLHIQVEDDGVGMEKAKQYRRRSTGRGLTINQALFDQLNQYNTLKSYQHFTDLTETDSGRSGVRAEAFLPLYPKLPPEEIPTENEVPQV
ncbi:sensor histidine kinase [Larkinella soli]|uniref:sensor histidine kinase n=1 Tax=Larkinella soli TaxID=1770527 RepID=UPI0013E2E275|nr:two-component regulator propeller domain-containing protein [Larkinella soli]